MRRNLKACHFENKNCTLLEKDVFLAIEQLKRKGEKFDRIYLDPPYTVDSIFHPVMEALGDAELLNEDGEVVIRTLHTKEMRDDYVKLHRYRTKNGEFPPPTFIKFDKKKRNQKDK
ncbi:RsmD family RNA methyltransferase [Allobaculum sp. Allo2]|nr:RsmD family RNA methyltransferase [Allobaculum sp. Allo2]